MTRGVLDRRLACLEAAHGPALRQRYVWVDQGEPMPEAEPGERLTIIRWRWETDPPSRSASMSGEEREGAPAGGRH